MSFSSAPPSRLLPALLTVGLFSACNDPSSVDSPYIVTPVTTATLSGTPGWALIDTLVVEVRDAEGNPVPGAKVHLVAARRVGSWRCSWRRRTTG